MSADFWAGYVSGAAGIIIGNPLDLIKVRLQAGTANPSETPSPNPGSALNPPPWSSSTRNQPLLPPSPTNPPRTTARTLLAGLPAPVLTYGALNALLFTTYNRTLALFPSTPSAQPTHSASAYFTAGALAGFATFIISAPTELVKCRAQLAASAAHSPSSWSIAKTTLATHGLRGLYVGGAVTSVRDAVGYGFYFWSYEAASAAWARRFEVAGGDGGGEGAVAAARVLLCGGLAGVVTWASIFPLDVVKTRVQTQALAGPALEEEQALLAERPRGASSPRQYAGAWEVARQAYAAEGAGVFFRGLTVCCVRAFLVNAVQWTVYEWMMKSMVVPSVKVDGI